MMADQLRFDALNFSSAGRMRIATPNLDRLAR